MIRDKPLRFNILYDTRSEQFSHLDIPWRLDYPTYLFYYLHTNLLAFYVSCVQI